MPRNDSARDSYNEYLRLYMKWRYHERRRIGIALLGGRCVDCGTKDDLEFDHIDPNEKTMEFNRMASASAERFLAEIRKCVLRCTEHHIEKSKRNNDYVQGRKRKKTTPA